MSRPWAVEEWAALTVLRRAGLGELGWRYRGVRGWMLAQEAGAEARRPLRPVLARLDAEELVRRVDVRALCQGEPLWLYRITDVGVRWVDQREGRPTRRPLPTDRDDPVDRGVFFLFRRRWDTLRALQAAHGGPGLSLKEIARCARAFPHEDVRWLVRVGLAERCPATTSSAPRRYAASRLGVEVRAAAPTTAEWAQLRLPAVPAPLPHVSALPCQRTVEDLVCKEPCRTNR